MVSKENEVPGYVSQGETIKRQFGATPLYTLNVNQLETLFKCWLWQQSQQAPAVAPTPTKFLTRKETAEKLNISLVTLDKYCRNGILIRRQVGSRYLFDETEINATITNKH